MKDALPLDLLLVEDNPDDAEMVLRVLRDRNLAGRHLVLEDGAQALDFFFSREPEETLPRHPRPRVILLDIKLPKVSGLEVLRAVKADERTRNIPVVILTSSREESDLREAYRLGANGYVVKPLKFNEFSDAIGSLGEFWLQTNLPASGY